MLATVPLHAARRRVFGSVFSPATLEAHPTKSTTLQHDQTPASFESTDSSSTFKDSQATSFATIGGSTDTASPEESALNQARLAAKEFLSVPNLGFDLIYKFRNTDGSEALKEWNRLSPPSKATAEALGHLMRTSPWSLFDWYANDIRRHFLVNFRTGLSKLLMCLDSDGLLRIIVDCLQLARRIYLAPVVHYLFPLIGNHQGAFLAQLQRAFHTVVSYSLPWAGISPLLSRELTQDAVVILGIDTLDEDSDVDEMSIDEADMERAYSVSYRRWRLESPESQAHMMVEGEDRRVTIARDQLLAFLNGLQLVGLGGDQAQKVFANVMNVMMGDFVRAAYAGEWEPHSSAPQHLGQWVENVYARLAVQVLAILHSDPAGSQSGAMDVSAPDVAKWKAMGIARLGKLRVSELFDVIVDWPASSGAVEDLRHFTVSSGARLYVANGFSAILPLRLLHPGASTVEILQVYISIIRAFHMLDPKGVLLDRIARPIRRYLRDRDDTVKVIVSGLLADPIGQEAAGDTLAELAAELTKVHHHSMQNNKSELDFEDMYWTPDPVDAAPDYKKSKSVDVIDSLVSLFDSKETFVKEMQTLLADRLMQKRQDFDQEITVLELLKVRFGDSALQACEVMLKDIADSRRLDHAVRNDRLFSSYRKQAGAGRLHAKILSRFFWPEFQEQEFKIPDEVQQLQERYATCFEKFKDTRKLRWRNALGQVTVELEFENHTFKDEVTTWQATVIYAFQSDSDEPATKAVPELAEELEMTPALVRSACLFWVSKRVLTEVQRDTYRVLEVLPTEDEEHHTHGAGTFTDASDSEAGDTANAAAAAEAAAAAAAKESAEAAAMEKMNVHWQFIVGMLTNQGAMGLDRIVMMLKIAVPGGFPFSNEELREFLGGMVSKGKLEIVNGGNYKIVH
ncbi:Cullin homology [Penicillium bovifimosum]|uniref:Anaphase-promoting complex subunit 2 n=1 Tax=Penicillium bovifimosum TaxID=126998 RepID=A0A9W9H674_9EURO|nr:Cullin homology [Penicillium bovifimosum]KAJ5139166.1 Cullin homology [Penicillium bovifimosum]